MVKNAGNVLIVDDDQLICDLLRDVLAYNNVSTTSANNGEEALRILHSSQDIDMVLTDVNMPGMNGLTLLERIKGISPEVPVVVVSGYGTERVAVKSLLEGAYNFCRKPFDMNELTTIVRKGLDLRKNSIREQEILPYLTVTLHFEIPSNITFVRSIVEHIEKEVARLRFPKKVFALRIKLALDEALVNAIKHGNNNDISKKVFIDTTISSQKMLIKITDQGDGFDVSEVPDPRDPQNLLIEGGRGLLLMGLYMDQISFSKNGTEVTMIKYADGPIDN